MTVGNGRIMCWKVASELTSKAFIQVIPVNNVILQCLNFRRCMFCFIGIRRWNCDWVWKGHRGKAQSFSVNYKVPFYTSRVCLQTELRITWLSLIKFRLKSSTVVVDCPGSLPVTAIMLNWLTTRARKIHKVPYPLPRTASYAHSHGVYSDSQLRSNHPHNILFIINIQGMFVT